MERPKSKFLMCINRYLVKEESNPFHYSSDRTPFTRRPRQVPREAPPREPPTISRLHRRTRVMAR